MVSERYRAEPPAETAWAVGGGRFGRRAVEQLKRIIPGLSIVVVDEFCTYTRRRRPVSL